MSSKPVMSGTSKPATAVAPKSTPPKQNATAASAAAAAAAAANKMHKRSRSGCFTCRLRRKKCDEGKPFCKACRHLGLKCEYKRPMWWSNNDQRRNQKEMIKNIIKRTKLTEKSSKDAVAAAVAGTGADSPPGLTHSLPTSATYSDAVGRTRAVSEDSSYSFDFNHQHVHTHHDSFDMYAPQVYTPHFDPQFSTYPHTSYDIDIKTERQTYVNGEPTRRDSSMSTFSSHYPPNHSTLATVPEGDYFHEDIYETPADMFSAPSDPIDFGYFDFNHPAPSSEQALIQVDDCDRHLLEHFIDNVLRLIFPILEASQPGSPRADAILHALETNKCYLHCCLSIAGIHLKSQSGAHLIPVDQHTDEERQLDADIVRHRYATVSELCEALKRDTDHAGILEATLAMMFFSSAVGRADDVLPDIAWHQHFGAAHSLLQKLKLPEQLLSSSVPASPPNFNMTLTAWIDILGATMLGRAPAFANTYREQHLRGASTGLQELMGCDDRMMYLISEISCLEALKLSAALDETELCSHITLLAQQIDTTEMPAGQLESAVTSSGALRPRVLGKNITALFRKAARIWLLSLIPGIGRTSPVLVNLVSQFAELLSYIPTGQGGFDRSIVWPLLMAGAQSTADSPLRAAMEERVASMDEMAETGSFGRMRVLLAEVWAMNDGRPEGEEGVSWRDVMQARGWDFLLL